MACLIEHTDDARSFEAVTLVAGVYRQRTVYYLNRTPVQRKSFKKENIMMCIATRSKKITAHVTVMRHEIDYRDVRKRDESSY